MTPHPFMPLRSGSHHLQIPGPTNLPSEVLQAMSRPLIDHRSDEFRHFSAGLLRSLRQVFGTSRPVVVYPGTGSGACEAALVNTLSPGDRVLAFETGHFALQWARMAANLGLVVDLVPGDWRHGVQPDEVVVRLEADREHAIKAVCVVHNETSTGVTSRVADLRAALDMSGHPALLLVDAMSSVGCIDYRHDEWGVDVTVSGSQKGLMLPPGLGFNAISDKALQASAGATMRRAYWDWRPMLDANADGWFPTTPATSLLFGLEVALQMIADEGLEQVFARHRRHARATRAAIRAWGLETVCLDDREHSPSLTAVLLPVRHDADRVRHVILQRFNMSLGGGLGRLSRRVFRIGHLGNFGDVDLIGTIGGVESGLRLSGVPIGRGGTLAALGSLEGAA